MKTEKLSIIIPAYNEEYRITDTVLDIYRTMSAQPFDYEILVVNDGSSDNTVAVVESLAKRIPNLSLINNHENRGKGWVIKQGMLKVTGNFRLFMDADNSTRVEEVIKMLPHLRQGTHVVVGSRCLPGSKIVIEQPLLRVFLGFVFRTITHMIVPIGVNDSQCGFKVFTEKSAQVIFPEQTIYHWSFDVEILAIAKKKKLKIKEMPVSWRNNKESHMNFLAMVRSFFEIIQIRLKLWGISTTFFARFLFTQKSN